jgi:hypothetical protein
MMTRHIAFFGLVLLILCSCAPSATWRCTTQQINEGDDLVRLTLKIERHRMPEGDSETIASPTILFRRGEAASMQIESDAYKICVEVPRSAAAEDLRVTVNGRSIPITPSDHNPPQEPANKDSDNSG